MATKKGSSRKRKSASKAKRVSRAAAPAPVASPIPDVIYAQASPRSISGVSMFETQHQINSGTVENFLSQEGATEAAVARLQMAGFDILQVTPFTINISGSA